MPTRKPTYTPATPLQPRIRALIVGASGGIGTALSRRLVRAGYTLALVDRNKQALTALCAAINSEYGETRVLPYVLDVTDYENVPQVLRRIVADLGGLDLFVYVAGAIYFPAIDEYNFPEDLKMVEVNLLGAMAWISQVAPLFLSKKRGQIVGVSSVAGDRGRVGNPGYNTSKAGFTAYLEALRNRLSRHGVNVITIKPGFVKTDMLKGIQNPMFAVSPEQAAQAIYSAIHRRKQQVYVAGIWYWIMLVIRNIPSILFRRMNI